MGIALGGGWCPPCSLGVRFPVFHNDNVKKIVFSIGFGIIGP